MVGGITNSPGPAVVVVVDGALVVVVANDVVVVVPELQLGWVGRLSQRSEGAATADEIPSKATERIATAAAADRVFHMDDMDNSNCWCLHDQGSWVYKSLLFWFALPGFWGVQTADGLLRKSGSSTVKWLLDPEEHTLDIPVITMEILPTTRRRAGGCRLTRHPIELSEREPWVWENSIRVVMLICLSD